MRKRRSFTNGDRFGQIEVLRRYDADDPTKAVIRCDCGAVRSVPAGNVPRLKSCGCLVIKHGMMGTPTHNSWANAKLRCENPRDHNYRNYGGRGIRVCERWQDFRNFLADMGERPDGTSIDRINGDGHYEPGNCRWVTPKVQANNIRPSLLDENGKRIKKPSEWYGGDPMTIDEAVIKYGVSSQRLYQIRRERENRAARNARRAARAARKHLAMDAAAEDARMFILGRRHR